MWIIGRLLHHTHPNAALPLVFTMIFLPFRLVNKLFVGLIFTSLLPAILCGAPVGDGYKRMTRAEYIANWKDEAIRQMREHRIPASITLAQAILESGDGNSELAREANNHFGIKCHDWQGKKAYHDDDAKKECFRKYNTAHESFEDHSAFLKRSRYLFLYDYKPSDYKSWAQGLKKAGYATNPKYPDLLIRIIEENKLDQYDDLASKVKGSKDQIEKGSKPAKKRNSSDEIVLEFGAGHTILKSDNNINYTVVETRTNVEKLAREVQMAPWQISKYNDFAKKAKIEPGTKVYLQPKRNKSSKHDSHTVATGETLHEISQLYGVKLARILKYNELQETYKPKPGDVLKLRK